MASPTLDTYLGVQVTIGVILAGALAFVARLTVEQHRATQFPAPARMFALWWAALGAAWLTWALDTLLVSSGADGRGAALLDYGLIVLYFGFILMAFASLFYYLLFLYVGSKRLSATVWWTYGAVTVGLVALLVAASPPASFEVSGLYADLFGGYTTFANVLRLALLLPVILAALALLWVPRSLPTGPQRRRARYLSASLVFYLLMPLLFGSNPGVEPDTTMEWFREAMNKLGLLVAIVAAVLAYRAPTPAKASAARSAGVGKEAARSALEARLRELI